MNGLQALEQTASTVKMEAARKTDSFNCSTSKNELTSKRMLNGELQMRNAMITTSSMRVVLRLFLDKHFCSGFFAAVPPFRGSPYFTVFTLHALDRISSGCHSRFIIPTKDRVITVVGNTNKMANEMTV